MSPKLSRVDKINITWLSWQRLSEDRKTKLKLITDSHGSANAENFENIGVVDAEIIDLTEIDENKEKLDSAKQQEEHMYSAA